MDLYIILFIHFTALLEFYSNISTLSQSEHHFPRVTDLNMPGLRARAGFSTICVSAKLQKSV